MVISADARPVVRPDLGFIEVDPQVIVVVDPETGRRFFLDGVQAALLQSLDGSRSLEEVAAEILEDPEAVEAVAEFVEKFDGLALLVSDRDRQARQRRQLDALRRQATAKRDEALGKTVRWAAQTIPFFRERIGARADDVHTLEDLAPLPTMDRQDLREHTRGSLLEEGTGLDELLAAGKARLLPTSGETGPSVEALQDTARMHPPLTFSGMWPLLRPGFVLRSVVFTTPHMMGEASREGTSYEERLEPGGEGLKLPHAHHVGRLTRPEAEHILEEWQRHEPEVLRCDPAYAVMLVRALRRHRLPIPRVAAVWAFHEYCSVLHRPLLEEAFGTTPCVVYSPVELNSGICAVQCPTGRFHVQQDRFVFEFVRQGRPVVAGELGEIVATTLATRYTAFLRYRLRDLARPIAEPCGCPEGHRPAFWLEGRIEDCVTDLEGRLVTTRAIDELFAGRRGIDHYELLQGADRTYALRTLTREGADPFQTREILDRARALLGAKSQIRLERVEELVPRPSGKFRLTASAAWSPPAIW